jgi:uncharacterized protein YciI
MPATNPEEHTVSLALQFRLPAVFLLFLASTSAPAQEKAAALPQPAMATTQMAFLTTADNAKPLGEREIQAIQEGHLRYLREQIDGGKVLIEGPIHGGGSLRSVIVLDVPTTADAEALLAKDPWIASKQLVATIHPWWSAKGLLRRPPRIERLSLCYLGLLERPADAPSLPDEKLQEIQKGHMANIVRMAESKDLVIAGPMGDDTALRGILLFRTTDPDRIRKLVAADPAVQAGRLRLDLLPWYVPEGTLPE